MPAVKYPLLKLLLLLTLACALLGGCDYPEAGFYEITAVDKGKPIGSFPFLIEELTDDTDLTIGFNVLRRRLISVLIDASKIKIGRKRFKTNDGSNPIRREKTSVMGRPASTSPVT